MREKVPASRQLGADDARRLIEAAKTVYVAKGAKLEQFSGGKPTEEHVQMLLGATGNLRAPTIQVGKTLLVGFNEGQFEKVLG